MSDEHESPIGPRAALLPLDRIKALVDGVLAVVITILVLGIDAPKSSIGANPQAYLRELELQLHPYIGSFGLVAAYWFQHAVILAFVRQANRVFIWLNIAFLLPVSLLPFLTELRMDHPEAMVTTVLFGAGQVASGALLLALWVYGTSKARFLARPLDAKVFRSMSVRIALGPLICILAAVVSLHAPHLGSAIFLCVPLLYISHPEVDAAWRSTSGET